MFSINDIRALCKNYGVGCKEINNIIDTSHGEGDKRYNYIIDNKYVLKINNSIVINEVFLDDIDRLIKRYRMIGVYCPNMIRNKFGELSYKFNKDDKNLLCYMEEYALYNAYEEGKNIDYKFKNTVIRHIGELAKNFTGVDLSKTRSMWSLIELGPFDKDRDEKQENLDILISTLKEKGYSNLVNRLVEENDKARNRIKQRLNELPRCVYQGDLNSSNILVDEKDNFKGIIDFNMFGTEVNINCFLNETMYYLTIEDFNTLTVTDIFAKMIEIQEDMMKEITCVYTLTELEKEVIEQYRKIIFISFYPNVMLWINLIEKCNMVNKVVDLLELILEVV